MKKNRIMCDRFTNTFYIQYRKWYWPFWKFIVDIDGRPQTYGFSNAIDTINRRHVKNNPSKENLICIKSI
jgi:hypothetical protein